MPHALLVHDFEGSLMGSAPLGPDFRGIVRAFEGLARTQIK